jgi:SAM-dependent methyltransferase
MTNTDREAQFQYWNGASGQLWADEQTSLDRRLGDLSAAVMDVANAKSGERVLDVGCGCGTTTFELATRVGHAGSVIGVDISAPMLAVATSRNRATNVTFVEADASTFAFEGDRDLIFSRFGVMFFADPVTAFTNIRTALAPGGRLAFICWRSMMDNAWAATPFNAAKHLIPSPSTPQPDPLAPGPFAFADADRTTSIVEAAGFSNVTIEALDSTVFLGDTLEEAVDASFAVGPLARSIAGADEATRQSARRAVLASLTDSVTSEGMNMTAACWLVSATG